MASLTVVRTSTTPDRGTYFSTSRRDKLKHLSSRQPAYQPEPNSGFQVICPCWKRLWLKQGLFPVGLLHAVGHGCQSCQPGVVSRDLHSWPVELDVVSFLHQHVIIFNLSFSLDVAFNLPIRRGRPNLRNMPKHHTQSILPVQLSNIPQEQICPVTDASTLLAVIR